MHLVVARQVWLPQVTCMVTTHLQHTHVSQIRANKGEQEQIPLVLPINTRTYGLHS